MKNVAMTVPLPGAKRPQLRKIKVSQKTTTITNGLETMVVPCSNINQRACPISACQSLTLPCEAIVVGHPFGESIRSIIKGPSQPPGGSQLRHFDICSGHNRPIM